MDIIHLKELIELRMSTHQIASRLKVSRSTVRYWLKKFNLATKPARYKNPEEITSRICPSCKEDLPLEKFYKRRGKEGNSVYCKECTCLQTTSRQRSLKEKAVEYKGGKCLICSYGKYVGALEFHHLDPSRKDFGIGKSKFLRFSKIKEELDKCVLLCSNCHREVHAGVIKLAPLAGFEPAQ